MEPIIGWRLWWAQGDVLHSWAADAAWDPGATGARCLVVGRPPCAHAPGRGCHCGLWAAHGPALCLRLAAEFWDRPLPMPQGRGVLGLVAGWGDVALHGDEGFRAERARPLVLFDDVVGLRRLRPMRRIYRARAATLRRVGERYGVPVLHLRDAVDHGVLAEMGVEKRAISEATALLGGGDPWYPPALNAGEPARR